MVFLRGINNMNMKDGAVTFLDVLGWKGIWREDPSSLRNLQSLVKFTKEIAEEITRIEIENNPVLRGIDTEVLSISDTIVIFTPGESKAALSIHAKICSHIIPESIKKKIPVRGATAYGAYTYEGSIMIGPGIDEAASWHESTNWIGVVLAPSGHFELGDEQNSHWIKYKHIPFKNRVMSLDHCVNWEMPLEDALESFKTMGPFVPGIAEKYLNTYEFIKAPKE